jgi:predicted O-methyltransferase YrrM
VTTRDHTGHIERNRRFWDEHAAGWHGPLARDHWSFRHPHWGLWSTPESQALMLPDDLAGMRAIELGCGTGYVSAWLARAGAHPVDPGGRTSAEARRPAGLRNMESTTSQLTHRIPNQPGARTPAGAPEGGLIVR